MPKYIHSSFVPFVLLLLMASCTGGRGGPSSRGDAAASRGDAGGNLLSKDARTAPREAGTVSWPDGGVLGPVHAETPLQIIVVPPGELRATGEVDIQVTVQDPDGVDDVLAGLVLNSAGMEIAKFIRTDDQGGYIATVRWGGVKPDPRLGDAPGQTEVVARVEFTEATGDRTAIDLSLPVLCYKKGGEGWFCDNSCVDRTTSPAHCGECGRAVGPLQKCEAGEFVCASLYYAACGDSSRCYDLTQDPTHCGACDQSCPVSDVSTTKCKVHPHRPNEHECFVNLLTRERTTCSAVCSSAGYSCFVGYSSYGVTGYHFDSEDVGYGKRLALCDVVPEPTNAQGEAFYGTACVCSATYAN